LKLPSNQKAQDSIFLGDKKRDWKTEFNSNYKPYPHHKNIENFETKNVKSELTSIFGDKEKNNFRTDYRDNYFKKYTELIPPVDMKKYNKFNIIQNDYQCLQSTYRNDFQLNLV
jgi:hypothetical protein